MSLQPYISGKASLSLSMIIYVWPIHLSYCSEVLIAFQYLAAG